MQDTEGSRAGVEQNACIAAVQELALCVAQRRMFSDLSDAEREDLVGTAIDACAFAWGPLGLPDDLEAWLALGMFHAMMDDFRGRRMLRRPGTAGEVTSLGGLLEEWLSTEPTRTEQDPPRVDDGLTDRFLRQLSPADARLLWLRCGGFTREEIAEVLGIRPNAVSVRLHRLRIRLRESLEQVADHAPAEASSPDSGTGAA